MRAPEESSHSWSSAQTWKVCMSQGIEGSNPSLSANPLKPFKMCSQIKKKTDEKCPKSGLLYPNPSPPVEAYYYRGNSGLIIDFNKPSTVPPDEPNLDREVWL